MKAKDFKEYTNYALSIELNDLDYEFGELFGNTYVWADAGNGCKIQKKLTDDELETIWNKEVISFYMKSSDIVWAVGSLDSTSNHSNGPQILVLNISRFSAEDREKRDRERVVNEKINELERLTNKKVYLTAK